MPRNLLTAAGPTITGQWVRTEPPAHKTWPFRLIFYGTGWTAGNVIVEELVDGLPTGKGPLTGNPGDETAGSQSGTVLSLGTFPSGSPDFTIDAPTEFLRARTDGAIVGTVSVKLIEAE